MSRIHTTFSCLAPCCATEGSAEHAHVHVHSEEHYVVNAALLEDAPDLFAAVTDVVVRPSSICKRSVCRIRGRFRIAAHACELLGPGGVRI